jgi:thiosulfate/3-mercaptopyruvate sulfurtransferase
MFWPVGPLVDATWLARRLGDPDVVVLDCRFDLSDPEAGERAYRRGHIPGALYVHLERDLSGPVGRHGGRHPLPSPEAFAAAMGARGVGEGRMAVVYDHDAATAPRAWWLLRFMGHDAVAVLDGGIAAWEAAGLPLEQGVPVPQSRPFVPRPRAHWVVDRDTVRRLPPGAVLVDARAPERYRGEVEPIDPRPGRIPGAVSSFFRDGLGPDGRWRNRDEQRRRFARLLGPGERMVAYCGSGVTACANLLAAAIAGLPDGLLYAGSYSDWISYPDAEVEVGEPRPAAEEGEGAG